jgi:hypothetical protein
MILYEQAMFYLRDIGCRSTRWIHFDGSGQTDFFARKCFQIKAEALAHAKAFIEEAKQSFADSTLEGAVTMEIENFEIPFPEVAEYEIFPLEDRVTLWGQSASLARLV